MSKPHADFPIAVHPGEVLRELLEDRGISQAELSRHLALDPSRVGDICRRKRGVSAEMAVLLGKALGTSPALWLNLQQAWDLSQVDRSLARKVSPIRVSA